MDTRKAAVDVMAMMDARVIAKKPIPHFYDAALANVDSSKVRGRAAAMFPKLPKQSSSSDERVALCVAARMLAVELCKTVDIETHVLSVSAMLISNNVTDESSDEFWNALMRLERTLLEMAL